MEEQTPGIREGRGGEGRVSAQLYDVRNCLGEYNFKKTIQIVLTAFLSNFSY